MHDAELMNVLDTRDKLLIISARLFFSKPDNAVDDVFSFTEAFYL